MTAQGNLAACERQNELHAAEIAAADRRIRGTQPHSQLITNEAALTGKTGIVIFHASDLTDPRKATFTAQQIADLKELIGKAKRALKRRQAAFKKVAGQFRNPYDAAFKTGARYFARTCIGNMPNPLYFKGDAIYPQDILKWGDFKVTGMRAQRMIERIPDEALIMFDQPADKEPAESEKP